MNDGRGIQKFELRTERGSAEGEIKDKDEEKSQVTDTIKKIVLGLLLILVVAIGIWGAVTAVRMAPGVLSDAIDFFRGRDDLVFSLSQDTAQSASSVEASWIHENNNEGFYTLRYSCAPNLSMQVPVNNERTTIACDTPYTIPSTVSSVTLIPIDENPSTKTTVSLSYTDDGGDVRTTKSATLTVLGATVGSGTGVENGQSAPIATPAAADLAVRLIDYTSISQNGTGGLAVRFEISNIGGTATGAWMFTADLPTTGTQRVFNSVSQSSLSPGDGIIYTLSFSQLQNGAIFRVRADANNQVNEVSKTNNVIEYRANTSGTTDGSNQFGVQQIFLDQFTQPVYY